MTLQGLPTWQGETFCSQTSWRMQHKWDPVTQAVCVPERDMSVAGRGHFRRSGVEEGSR